MSEEGTETESGRAAPEPQAEQGAPAGERPVRSAPPPDVPEPAPLLDPHAPPPPPPAPAPPKVEEPPPSEYVIKRRPMWPFALVLLAIAGGIAALVVYLQGRPEPLRVLVAIDYDGEPWEGSKASARFSDNVCDLLKKVGFEPVKIGDPAVDKILETAKSPEEAAKKLKAAFVITGKLTPKVVEEKLPAGAASDRYFEARVDGDVEIRQIEDAAGKSDKVHVSNWSGERTKEDAVQVVGDGLSDVVFDEIAPRMMAHPAIKDLLAGTDVKALAQIQDAKKYVERRTHMLDDAKKKYDDLGKEHTSTPQKTRAITYLSKFDADDALAGVGPDGVLVHTADVAPLVSPRTADLAELIRLETLEWRPTGGEPKVVWKGYHLYSDASVSPTGSPIVFVEDLFGRAKTITVVDKGEARRVRVDPSFRFIHPVIAPGGGAAAMTANPCRDCASGLLVVSLKDGQTLHERRDDDRYGGYTWLDDHRLAYLVEPPENVDAVLNSAPDSDKDPAKADEDKPAARTFDLMVFDVSSNSERKLGGYDADGDFGSPVTSPDGKRIAVVHAANGGQYLALVDVDSGTLRDLTSTGGAESPAFSPDGSLIAYTSGGDLRLYHLADGSIEELTSNPIIEREPVFSPDGSRIYFESLDQDPNFPRRAVRFIASVAVKP